MVAVEGCNHIRGSKDEFKKSFHTVEDVISAPRKWVDPEKTESYITFPKALNSLGISDHEFK